VDSQERLLTLEDLLGRPRGIKLSRTQQRLVFTLGDVLSAGRWETIPEVYGETARRMGITRVNLRNRLKYLRDTKYDKAD
jgi:hypothetical protein